MKTFCQLICNKNIYFKPEHLSSLSLSLDSTLCALYQALDEPLAHKDFFDKVSKLVMVSSSSPTYRNILHRPRSIAHNSSIYVHICTEYKVCTVREFRIKIVSLSYRYCVLVVLLVMYIMGYFCFKTHLDGP